MQTATSSSQMERLRRLEIHLPHVVERNPRRTRKIRFPRTGHCTGNRRADRSHGLQRIGSLHAAARSAKPDGGRCRGAATKQADGCGLRNHSQARVRWHPNHACYRNGKHGVIGRPHSGSCFHQGRRFHTISILRTWWNSILRMHGWMKIQLLYPMNCCVG